MQVRHDFRVLSGSLPIAFGESRPWYMPVLDVLEARCPAVGRGWLEKSSDNRRWFRDCGLTC
jgi:hypothetical protein